MKLIFDIITFLLSEYIFLVIPLFLIFLSDGRKDRIKKLLSPIPFLLLFSAPLYLIIGSSTILPYFFLMVKIALFLLSIIGIISLAGLGINFLIKKYEEKFKADEDQIIELENDVKESEAKNIVEKDLKEYKENLELLLSKYKEQGRNSSKELEAEIFRLLHNLDNLYKIEKYDSKTIEKIEKFCDIYLPVLIINLEKGLRFYSKKDSYIKMTKYTKTISLAIDKMIDTVAESDTLNTTVDMDSYENLLKSQGYLDDDIFLKNEQNIYRQGKVA